MARAITLATRSLKGHVMFDKTSLWGNLDDVMHLGERVKLISGIMTAGLGSIFGMSPPNDAPGVIKGVYGIFGSKEERVLSNILRGLEEKDRKVFSDLCNWLFKTDGSVAQGLEALWLQNAFFVFIAKDHKFASDSKTEKKKEMVKDIVEQILLQHGTSTKEIGALAFRKAVKRFQTEGVPIAKVGESGLTKAGKFLMGLASRTGVEIRNFDNYLETYAKEITQRKTPWFARIMTLGIRK